MLKTLHILKSVASILGCHECLLIPDGGSEAQQLTLRVLDRGEEHLGTTAGVPLWSRLLELLSI